MSGSASCSCSKVTLNLVVDTEASKVLCAEADKTFVDFLLGLLTLPVGAVIKLLKDKGNVYKVGSLAALYKSVERLSESYVAHSQGKDTLLQPNVVCTTRGHGPVFDGARVSVKQRRSSGGYALKRPACDTFHALTELQIADKLTSTYSMPLSGGEEFVKGVSTYMVMDDLSVLPMSSSLRIFHVMSSAKDVRGIEEKKVKFGDDEALSLLKTSFSSENVLTDVFLNPRPT